MNMKQISSETYPYIDKHGSLSWWIEDALDKTRWNWMIDTRLRFQHLDFDAEVDSFSPATILSSFSFLVSSFAFSNQRVM